MGDTWTVADQRAEYIRLENIRRRLQDFLREVSGEPDHATFSDWTARDELLKVGDLRVLYNLLQVKLWGEEEEIDRGLTLSREEARGARKVA